MNNICDEDRLGNGTASDAPQSTIAPRVAVVIPARDESAVISRCLSSLYEQQGNLLLDVVVVADGCKDQTVEEALKFGKFFADKGYILRVSKQEALGKPAALNAGDRDVSGDIRIYLDADAILSTGAVAALVRVLSGSSPLLAAPRLVLDLPAIGPARHHGRVWRALPPMSDDVMGAGCFAVNCTGRERWSTFPQLIADDAFVCGQFRQHERIVVQEETFTVPYPDSTEIVSVLARWQFGNAQLAATHSTHRRTDLRRARARVLLSSPKLWPSLPWFILITLLARLKVGNLSQVRFAEWPRARRKS
jgi:hypothetical protein